MSWLVNVVNENSDSLFSTIGLGDFLVHHAIALNLHTKIIYGVTICGVAFKIMTP